MSSENLTQELQKENELLRQTVKYLEEQVEWFKRQIFGSRSEKTIKQSDDQLFLKGLEDLPKVQEESREVKSHQRRSPKKKGSDKIEFPEDLPKKTIILDVSDENKFCPETGKDLVMIGEEVTQKLAYKPGSYYIKEIIRPKYAYPKETDKGILTAELPDSIIPGCIADESFLAEILTKKFADHLPLYRICQGLERENIVISRKLLSKWVIRTGQALKPLYHLMLKKTLEYKNLFMDETPVKMQSPGKGKTHQAYMWVAVGGCSKDPPYCIYYFAQNRKHNNVFDLIGEYEGVLHSDKYGAYETLATDKKITWCPCWSHIRRKFVEAESGDSEFRTWVLRKIRYLFMLERVAWDRSEKERQEIRKKKEIPIIDELICTIKKKLIQGKIIRKSKFREALGYFCGLIPFLKNYTKSPYSQLDNNVAERAIRPLAIGRKNWLFVGSPDGGEAAAIIYSFVQTCRVVGINPREYLEEILRKIMGHPYKDLDQLLPENWVASKLNQS